MSSAIIWSYVVRCVEKYRVLSPPREPHAAVLNAVDRRIEVAQCCIGLMGVCLDPREARIGRRHASLVMGALIQRLRLRELGFSILPSLTRLGNRREFAISVGCFDTLVNRGSKTDRLLQQRPGGGRVIQRNSSAREPDEKSAAGEAASVLGGAPAPYVKVDRAIAARPFSSGTYTFIQTMPHCKRIFFVKQ
jgi:hypothetical protein